MNLFEYIKKEKKQQGLNYKEIPEVLGISPQRFYKIMEQEDCQLSVARKMVNALGKNLEIRKTDGASADVDSEDTLHKLEVSRATLSISKTMVEMAGYALFVVDNTETHKNALSGINLRI